MSVSASKSALLLSPCLRWAGEGAKEYEDQFADTTKRDKGTEFHNYMDMYYRHGTVGRSMMAKAPSPDVWDWFLKAREWSQKHLEPRLAEGHEREPTLFSEVYVAFNFNNGEVHTDDSVRDRKYPVKPGFLPGTTDLVCVLADGRLLVADWKTGGGTGADKQLLTLALGLQQVFKKQDGSLREVVLSILYVSDDGVHPVEWAVTDDELEAHRVAMRFQLLDVGHRNTAVPGIHCTQLYCPHLAYCPGITSSIEAASEAPQGLLPVERLVRKYDISSEPSSPAHAGAIMERVTAAKRQMKFYEERIKQYCEDGGKCVAGDFEYSRGKDGFRWRQRKS